MEGSGGQAHYLDCGECRKTLGDEERALLRCAWVEPHRLPELPPEPHPPHELLPATVPAVPAIVSPDCPGYLIQQPEVLDALHAHLWWDKGQLERYVRDQPVSHLLELYVDTATGAIADLRLEQDRERERERRNAEAQANHRR